VELAMWTTVGGVFLSAAIWMQTSLDYAAPANPRAGLIQEAQAFALAHGKYDDKIPPEVLAGLGLNGGPTGYPECLVAWQDDDNSTYHYIFAGLDKEGVLLTFKPADASYAISWRLNNSGRLISTTQSDQNGSRTAPNDQFADALDNELNYWRIHLADEEKARGREACTPPQ
jgi:hypothetical protein